MDELGDLLKSATRSGLKGDETEYEKLTAKARDLVEECGTEVGRFYAERIEPRLKKDRRVGLLRERGKRAYEALERVLHGDYSGVKASLARVAHINDRLNGSPLRGMAYEYAQKVPKLVDRAKEIIASRLEKVTKYKR